MGGVKAAGSVSDESVRATLEQELRRLTGARPLAALGLADCASAEMVRARFLELTKRHHPNRFARRPPDILRLANEVFLRLKEAYERVARDQPADSNPSRRITEKSRRLQDLSPSTQPKLDVDAALARRRRLRSHPGLPATGATPPPQVDDEITSPIPLVTQQELLERVRRRDEEHKDRFRAAVHDLRVGRLEVALQAFRALLAESPTDKSVRTYLHYSLGREHHAAGRSAEARAEYEKALSIDPSFEAAQKSLGLLGEPARGEERGGLISRFFRR